ncbi:MAG: hypothetical protein KAI24_06015 [Planctomycetes bacterium]|nr:hypothetical protein [Planctomycetota bacterium]
MGLLANLAGRIDALKLAARDDGDALILMGPRHHLHALSELSPAAVDLLAMIQEHAPELRALQRDYLPREFWEEYGNLDLDESDPSPLVRLLLAHKEQPIVSCALCAVGRGLGIDMERRYLFGALTVMVDTMRTSIASAPGSKASPPSRHLRRIMEERTSLPTSAVWALRQLLSGTANIKQLRCREGAPSLGTLKRWLPRLRQRGLARSKSYGSGNDWDLTDLGRAVASDPVA